MDPTILTAGLGSAILGVIWSIKSATSGYSLNPEADIRAGFLMLVFGGLVCALAWVPQLKE